jgi:hypothetical protein
MYPEKRLPVGLVNGNRRQVDADLGLKVRGQPEARR